MRLVNAYFEPKKQQENAKHIGFCFLKRNLLKTNKQALRT